LRTGILLVAVVATTAFLGAGTPAWAAPGEAQPFADQAKAAHLTHAQTTELQSKVNYYLEKVGGKQVALNRIMFNGGQLLVAVSGEAHPMYFDSPVKATDDNCNVLTGFETGWFCAYSKPWYAGDELQWYYCGTYPMPWSGYGSWDNEQYKGTKAQFLDYSRNANYTTPPAASWNHNYNWTPVYYVKPC
jgi:hypothetical protein